MTRRWWCYARFYDLDGGRAVYVGSTGDLAERDGQHRRCEHSATAHAEQHGRLVHVHVEPHAGEHDALTAEIAMFDAAAACDGLRLLNTRRPTRV